MLLSSSSNPKVIIRYTIKRSPFQDDPIVLFIGPFKAFNISCTWVCKRDFCNPLTPPWTGPPASVSVVESWIWWGNNLFFSQKDYLLCGIFITNVFCCWSRSSSVAFAMTTVLMTAARMSAMRTKTTLRMHFRWPRRWLLLSSGKSLMEASVSSILKTFLIFTNECVVANWRQVVTPNNGIFFKGQIPKISVNLIQIQTTGWPNKFLFLAEKSVKLKGDLHCLART